jgi:hypothetical protein
MCSFHFHRMPHSGYSLSGSPFQLSYAAVWITNATQLIMTFAEHVERFNFNLSLLFWHLCYGSEIPHDFCCSGDDHITSISEFSIHKVHSSRHPEPQRRTLCLSETCLLERDPQTYSICTLRPLADIFALVRSQDNPQLFNVEYVNGQVRTYTATDR